ncbi:calcitonin gene-related peptide type 1 receptor-like [Ylistrum balloti]|uniref:calcitonin gene-related peptide type 1 receptor-like n=1 Tax=Ylistrum balloti TaxID=509963 RepID=UPI002905F6F2|nr:calcitonin gene-related peptide type 1 receptor-like [Ylistrum balloti]
MALCRDSSGYFNASVFNVWTCAWCYKFLFQQRISKEINLDPDWNGGSPLLVFRNGTFSAVPDIDDLGQIERVCGTLDSADCARWTSCCQAAKSCCQRQTHARPKGRNTCPSTWDGFGCFEETDAGQTAVINCPEFIEYGFVSDYATKKCTENATWWREQLHFREWTDYTPCLKIKVYKSVVYIGITCCSLSIALLVPAITIFLSIKQLRSQQRIRLHLCLFLSFMLTSVFTLFWDLFVYSDLLSNPRHHTTMHRNSFGCRLLYFLKRYSVSTNYFWMFCEGLYLHRLIVHAFRVPRFLLWYYLLGWGLPFVPVSIYAVIKAGIANHGCWIKNMDAYEWIIYSPNIFCILANCMFLCSILRIMVSQLQTHPNEPSGYRRAIKATFVLVPLFGIQIFVIIYRPHGSTSHRFFYEIISKIITDSQGAIITLIYCYGSGEVHSCLRSRCRSCIREFYIRNNTATRTPSVSMTQYTAITTSQPRLSSSKDTILYSTKGDHSENKKRVNVNGQVHTQNFHR